MCRNSVVKQLIFLSIFLTWVGANPLGSSGGLYNSSVPIVQLSAADFKSTIIGTSHAWLVEFYSSWCGHCINFAPSFVELAKSVEGWDKVIKVAAIDCAKDENIPLCRDYEIMGYPTLKFFPAFTDGDNLGVTYKGDKKIEDIRHSMINFVETQFSEKKAPSHWPLLSPLQNETLEDLWNHYNTEELVLLFEIADDAQYWSREAILDAHQFNQKFPPIRRVNPNQQDLINEFNIKNLPAMVFLERTGRKDVFQVQPNREFILKLLKRFFDSAKGDQHEVENNRVPDAPHNKEVQVKNTVTNNIVYMSDLEAALLYAFGHEVSQHKVIARKELAALKEFVDVLAAYFPGEQLRSSLAIIQQKLTPVKRLRGEDFAEWWKSATSHVKRQDWIGCRGSKPHLRGYPCSLWTLFHTLTVNYALKNDDSAIEPALILQAMKGFIQYFFGCSYCSNHFVNMAEDESDPIEKVSSPKEAVLWLWRAHNKVNRRLASTGSEDPFAPKIQFPSSDNCPNCQKNGVFDRQAVYEYLVNLYRPESIKSVHVQEGIPADKLQPGQSQANSLSFTGFDISIYAVIYLISCLISMIVLLRIFFKRRTLRKTLSSAFGKFL